MDSETDWGNAIIGGYFPMGKRSAELSLELPGAAPLNICIQIEQNGELSIAGTSRPVSWPETRLVKGSLKLIARYGRDLALERLERNAEESPFAGDFDGAASDGLQ